MGEGEIADQLLLHVYEARRRDLLVKHAHRCLDDLLDTPDVSSRQARKSIRRPPGESRDEDDGEVGTKLDERGECVKDAGDEIAIPTSRIERTTKKEKRVSRSRMVCMK
jgi:hypothetical protein